MLVGMYSIFNSVAVEHAEPFLSKNDELAKIKFADSIERSISKQKRIPLESFKLVKVALFDSETGKVDGSVLSVIASASDKNLNIDLDSALDEAQPMSQEEMVNAKKPLEM